MTGDPELWAALSRRELPATFQRWQVTLAAGEERPTDAVEWAGALVLVESGTLEVACDSGSQREFSEGDLLVLGWLPLRTLRSPGPEATSLLAVRRAGRPPADPFLRVIRSASIADPDNREEPHERTSDASK